MTADGGSGGADLSTQACPRHAPGVREVSTPGGAMLVTADGSTLELNQTASVLWDLCDGTVRVEEIVTAASALFDGPPERIQHDVREALIDLRDHGALVVDG